MASAKWKIWEIKNVWFNFRILSHPKIDPQNGSIIIMIQPAYDYCIKASHVFNLLDSRGVISPTERQNFISRVRNLAKSCAKAYIESEEG